MQVHTQNSIYQFQTAMKSAEFHSFRGIKNIYNSNSPTAISCCNWLSEWKKKIFMTITEKWIFIFKGSLYRHWLSCHPTLLKAFTPFTAMPQKSIAIYSLFGPQATKVNNTVTSSLTAEHGHKTALPLKYNRTQLFVYARSAECWLSQGTNPSEEPHTELRL